LIHIEDMESFADYLGDFLDNTGLSCARLADQKQGLVGLDAL